MTRVARSTARLTHLHVQAGVSVVATAIALLRTIEKRQEYLESTWNNPRDSPAAIVRRHRNFAIAIAIACIWCFVTFVLSLVGILNSSDRMGFIWRHICFWSDDASAVILVGLCIHPMTSRSLSWSELVSAKNAATGGSGSTTENSMNTSSMGSTFYQSKANNAGADDGSSIDNSESSAVTSMNDGDPKSAVDGEHNDDDRDVELTAL